jgi:HemY protein
VEAETYNTGLIREWLSRASRAARDKAWVADGVVSDQWSPVSPVTGKLDAFRWQTPPERLSAPVEPLPEAPLPEPKLLETEPAPAPAVLEAPAADPAPVVEVPAADEDASHRLAAIRAAAKAAPAAAPTPRKPDVFPLVTAPDDPGPDPKG